MNREARPGETLAVVTFANVEGLDVLLDVIQRIRREKFPEAQAAQGEPAEHWHRLYLEKCQQYNDRVAQLGGVIEALDAEAAQGAGEVVAELKRLASVCPELNLNNYGPDDVDELNAWAVEVAQAIDQLSDTQPAAGADVLDAQRYRWLRDQHQGQTEQAYDAEGFPLPQEPTAIACTVFKPGRDLCLEPISCTPGELDAHIDAAIAASGRKS